MSINIKRLDLVPKTFETVWIGDSAVDKEKSNIKEWAATGDQGFLVMKPDETPDTVVYRGLTAAELAILPSSLDGDNLHPNYLRTAGAIGLISVGKQVLSRRKSSDGIKMLTPQMMECLETADLTSEVPFPDIFFSMRLEEIAADEEVESFDHPLSFLEWIGVLIVSATFRSRRSPV